jgi:hypothetical protein
MFITNFDILILKIKELFFNIFLIKKQKSALLNTKGQKGRFYMQVVEKPWHLTCGGVKLVLCNEGPLCWSQEVG